MARTISAIAEDIEQNWTKVNFAARPYLDAMKTLDNMHSKFYADDADTIVRYFLSNASSFRGDAARRIKAELKSML